MAPPTISQATLVANAVNLQPGDLPGYQTSSPDNSDNDTTTNQLEACAGAAPQSAQIVDLNSDNFTQGSSLPQIEISSSVTAEQSTADAQTDLTSIRSAKARQCIVTFFNQEVSQGAGSGITISNTTITPTVTVAPGTNGSFGDTLTATMTDQGVQVSIAVDFEGFVDKNCEVELDSVGIGESPSSSTDQRLLGLLVNRAVAAVH